MTNLSKVLKLLMAEDTKGAKAALHQHIVKQSKTIVESLEGHQMDECDCEGECKCDEKDHMNESEGGETFNVKFEDFNDDRDTLLSFASKDDAEIYMAIGDAIDSGGMYHDSGLRADSYVDQVASQVVPAGTLSKFAALAQRITANKDEDGYVSDEQIEAAIVEMNSILEQYTDELSNSIDDEEDMDESIVTEDFDDQVFDLAGGFFSETPFTKGDSGYEQLEGINFDVSVAWVKIPSNEDPEDSEVFDKYTGMATAIGQENGETGDTYSLQVHECEDDPEGQTISYIAYAVWTDAQEFENDDDDMDDMDESIVNEYGDEDEDEDEDEDNDDDDDDDDEYEYDSDRDFSDEHAQWAHDCVEYATDSLEYGPETTERFVELMDPEKFWEEMSNAQDQGSMRASRAISRQYDNSDEADHVSDAAESYMQNNVEILMSIAQVFCNEISTTSGIDYQKMVSWYKRKKGHLRLVKNESDDFGLAGLEESYKMEKAKAVKTTGTNEVGAGKKLKDFKDSPLPKRKGDGRVGGSAASSKGVEHTGFERETAPKVATMGMKAKNGQQELKKVPKGGSASAELNKTKIDKKSKSPINGDPKMQAKDLMRKK